MANEIITPQQFSRYMLELIQETIKESDMNAEEQTQFWNAISLSWFGGTRPVDEDD